MKYYLTLALSDAKHLPIFKQNANRVIFLYLKWVVRRWPFHHRLAANRIPPRKFKILHPLPA